MNGYTSNTNKNTSTRKIPKVIWTFWDCQDTSKIPQSVKICIKLWKKLNPEYAIILLTRKNLKDYISIPDEILHHKNFNDQPQRFSDLVRVCILAEHGGVWSDSSNIMLKPLNKLFDTGNELGIGIEIGINRREIEFYGFYIEKFTDVKKNFPVIESWFFACIPKSPFVQLWRDEFLKMGLNFKRVDEYIGDRFLRGVDFQNIDGILYLAIHIAAQKVLQIDKYPLERLFLLKAEDGPLKFLNDSKWNSKNAVIHALELLKYNNNNNYDKNDNNDKEELPLFFKFRGGERKYLDSLLAKNHELCQSLLNMLNNDLE